MRGEVKRGEKKKNKKIIYTVNNNRVYIHSYYFLQDYCAYLEIFKKTDVGGGGLKCVKLSTFCILEDYT